MDIMDYNTGLDTNSLVDCGGQDGNITFPALRHILPIDILYIIYTSISMLLMLLLVININIYNNIYI